MHLAYSVIAINNNYSHCSAAEFHTTTTATQCILDHYHQFQFKQNEIFSSESNAHFFTAYKTYDPALDGRAKVYTNLFLETRASLAGTRHFFANTRAALRGEGIFFADTRAVLHGQRPLFANTRTALK
jgi:hypothetical protein